MDIKELPWAALPLENTLYGFLIWMEQEYESSSTAKFMLHVVFFARILISQDCGNCQSVSGKYGPTINPPTAKCTA
ncbi:hypothetical protein ACFQY3_07520 [Paenibacillus farraposensis]|uniref:hypothetical protein n=1 Tax=Paenibacillus farraposensis TaxID=2807095 RepID=UPI003609B308